jgi:hypothetical protein
VNSLPYSQLAPRAITGCILTVGACWQFSDDGIMCSMQNLNDHLSDPGNVNAFQYATKFTPSN